MKKRQKSFKKVFTKTIICCIIDKDKGKAERLATKYIKPPNVTVRRFTVGGGRHE